MPRGGRRPGSGGKPTWKHGKTKTIRVPIALSARILQIAKALDDPDNVSQHPVIDLSGVAVIASSGGPVVRLADLLRVGYRIEPENLVKGLKAQSQEALSLDDLLKKAEQQYE